MAKKKESRLQKRIHKAIKKEFNWWGFKSHGSMFQAAGLPDIIGCCAGLFFGIEVKTSDGDTSEIQDEVLHDIRTKGGGYSTVVTTPKEAIDYIRRVLAKKDLLLEGVKAPTKRRRGVLRATLRKRTPFQAASRKNLHRRRAH